MDLHSIFSLMNLLMWPILIGSLHHQVVLVCYHCNIQDFVVLVYYRCNIQDFLVIKRLRIWFLLMKSILTFLFSCSFYIFLGRLSLLYNLKVTFVSNLLRRYACTWRLIQNPQTVLKLTNCTGWSRQDWFDYEKQINDEKLLLSLLVHAPIWRSKEHDINQ